MLIGPGEMPALEGAQRAHGLGRPELATIAKHGRQIALQRIINLRFKAREGAKMIRPLEPVDGVP